MTTSPLFLDLFQVSKEDEGKLVDSRCNKLTASHIRRKHKSDASIPICLFYEVGYLHIHTHTCTHIHSSVHYRNLML